MERRAAAAVSSVVDDEEEEHGESGMGGTGGMVHDDEEEGRVVSVRDSFGFIRCEDREGQLFFHVSELVDEECMPLPTHLRKMAMTALVNLGDEVAFKVTAAASMSDGAKPNAIQVRRLPPGTIKANREVAIECEQVKGKVVRELRGVKTSAGRISAGYGGVVSYSLDSDTANNAHMVTLTGGADDVSNGNSSNGEGASEANAAAADRTSGGHEVRLPFTMDCIAEGVNVFRGQFRSGMRVVFDVVSDRRGQKRVARLRPLPPPSADGGAASAGVNGSVEAGIGDLAPREYGVISSIRDTYGFIRCADREGRMFFHVSALVDISENMLRTGLEVSFCPSIDKTNRGTTAKSSSSPALGNGSQQQQQQQRTVAVSVKAMPRGTVSFVKKLQEKVEGVVEKAAVAPRSQEQMDGVIVYKSALKTEISPASLRSSHDGCSDRSGDTPIGGEIPIGGDDEGRSTEGEAEAETTTTTTGVDTASSNTDASMAPVTIYEEKRISYGCNSVDDPRVRLGVGDKVSFSILVDRGRGGGGSGGAGPQYHAVDIVRTVEAETPEVSRDLGIRRPARDTATGVDLPFSGGEAEDEDAAEEAERQLGVVASLRMNFGFIRCCDRKGPDLFFHFTAVDPESVSVRDDGTPNLRLGDNLEFSVRRDKRTEKDIAANVKKVAKGTAVFDTVADRVYEGICKEPAQKSYMSGKSGSSLASSSGRAGIIEYFLDADDLGEDESTVGDCPALVPSNDHDVTTDNNGDDERHADVARQTHRADERNQEGGKDNCDGDSTSTSAAAADGTTSANKNNSDTSVASCDAGATKQQDIVGVPSEDSSTMNDDGQDTTAVVVVDAEVGGAGDSSGEQADTNVNNADIIECTPPEDAAAATEHSLESRRVATLLFTGSDVKERMFPRVGDDVIFQIATDKKTGKLRATNVAVSHKYGTVSAFNSTFGFVIFKDPKSGLSEKIYFHACDVHGGDVLKPGDEVEFIAQVNPSTMKKCCRRVKFVKEGDAPPPSATPLHDSSRRPVVHVRPASTQFQNKTQASSARQVKIPDGTKGFLNVGRGGRIGPPTTVLEARIGQKKKEREAAAAAAAALAAVTDGEAAKKSSKSAARGLGRSAANEAAQFADANVTIMMRKDTTETTEKSTSASCPPGGPASLPSVSSSGSLNVAAKPFVPLGR